VRLDDPARWRRRAACKTRFLPCSGGFRNRGLAPWCLQRPFAADSSNGGMTGQPSRHDEWRLVDRFTSFREAKSADHRRSAGLGGIAGQAYRYRIFRATDDGGVRAGVGTASRDSGNPDFRQVAELKNRLEFRGHSQRTRVAVGESRSRTSRKSPEQRFSRIQMGRRARGRPAPCQTSVPAATLAASLVGTQLRANTSLGRGRMGSVLRSTGDGINWNARLSCRSFVGGQDDFARK